MIYGNPHVTLGDWLAEAVSSGATALAHPENASIAERPGPLEDRVQDAHHTTVTALSLIGAPEALATQTGDPKLADRQWVVCNAAREAVESWQELSEEHNGLEYAVASWLPNTLLAYVRPFEQSAEVDPMEIAKYLIRALGCTAGELAVGEEEGVGQLAYLGDR